MQDPSEQGRRSADMDILDCPLPEDPEERLSFYRGKREAEREKGVRRDVKDMLRRAIERQWKFRRA